MSVAVPTKSPFGKRQAKKLIDFSGGLNTKFSPLLLDDKEVQDIQNFNYDEKGALTKRKGFVKHYAASFATGPLRDMTNYRKQDGTSRLVLAADDKLFYDNPQFTQKYDAEADWETAATLRDRIDTTTVAGDISPDLGTLSGLGRLGLGGKGGSLGGTMTRPEAVWRSNTLDITAVQDKTTGKAASTLTQPTGTTVVIETRVSPDQVTWDCWLGLGAGNAIQTVGTRNFLQVRARLNSTSGLRASAQSIVVTFDITPTVTQLTTGLSTLARYTFATQNDVLYIFNGVDSNKKWDGTTFGTQGGSPPVAKYAIVHKNIMFLSGNGTNPSRLYFSDIGLPESWPALNFIDVGKGDGDQITGLAILLDRLVITKQNSVWLLEGDASSNFILRRVADVAGCVDQHSIVVVKNTLGMLARDGFYFFDGVNMTLASEKIYTTFQGLNSGQFGLVAAIYYPSIRKIFVSVPSGSMTTNDTVLIFDTLRTAWTIYKGINAASWVIWRQFQVDHLLFGDASVGQIYDAETGYSDNGAAISGYVVTKALDLGGSELAKTIAEAFVDAKERSGTGDTTASVSYFKDLQTAESATQSVAVTTAQVSIARTTPSAVGVSTVRNLAIKVAHSSATTSIAIYGITCEYVLKPGLRAT